MTIRFLGAVALIGGALMLSACVGGGGVAPTQTPITVPESLKPTNVPEPVQKVDAACATSWVKFERLLTQYDADSARAAVEARVEFDPDDPYDIARDATGADDYYATLSELTVTFGTDVGAIADSVTNPQVNEVLAAIGEGHVDAGTFLAGYTDPSTSDDDIAQFEDDYYETMLQMSQYASLCDETLSGGTSDS